ncbi:MAG: alpha/beta hydrolase family protein [Candidatus Nanoarchaeia archaeon]
MEKLFFRNSKGDSICGVLSNPTGTIGEPVVILCHGFSTSKEGGTYIVLEGLLNVKDISTFRFDFYGHGESDGKFKDITISEAVDDILNAIRFLKSKGYKKIGLMGSSFGGMAGILAVPRTDDLFVLALKSPVSDYLGKLIAQKSREEIRSWRKKGFIYYRKSDGRKLKLNYSFFEDSETLRGYESAKKIKIPTLIVHGDADDSVPVEQSRKTASLIEGCRLEVMRGADHQYSNPEHKERLLRLITEFIIDKSCL